MRIRFKLSAMGTMTAHIASIKHDIENPAVNEGRSTCPFLLKYFCKGGGRRETIRLPSFCSFDQDILFKECCSVEQHGSISIKVFPIFPVVHLLQSSFHILSHRIF